MSEIINFIIEKTDGTVLGFREKKEFMEAVSDLIDREEMRAAWGRIQPLLRDLHELERREQTLFTELENSMKFRAKLKKNGAYADGYPRLSISIPKAELRKTYIDPDAEWGILIVSPTLIDDLSRFEDLTDDTDTEILDLYRRHETR